MAITEDLTDDEINALVTVALAGGQRRAVWNYKRYNALAHKGLTEIIHMGKVYYTHRLTRAGIEAVLALPDDYRRSFYPLPADIAKAKAIARTLND
jgi:hypothetical protein